MMTETQPATNVRGFPLPLLESFYELARHNRQAGYHFFDADTRRFFCSRMGALIGQSTDRRIVVFTTSEKFESPHGDKPRAWTVRVLDVERGDMACDPHGFQAFDTAAKARTAGAKFLRAYEAHDWTRGLMRDEYTDLGSLHSWCRFHFPKGGNL